MASSQIVAQIADMVRNLPDEALLDLVRNQLSLPGGLPAAPRGPGRPRGSVSAAKPAAAAAAAAPARRGPGRPPGRPRRAAAAATGRGRRAGAPSAERQEALSSIERIVKSGSGLSASEVAKAANVPQTRAAASLKELKLQKRIFQGGDRRFARYAGDMKTAEQASLTARRTAAGPNVGGGRRGGRGRGKKK